MQNIKGTRTEANLMAAYAGESQATNKYVYYAKRAKNDGYIQISDIFFETASNESAHAKIWFKLLHDGAVPDTVANLKDAANGEHFEWSQMYAEFAKVAKEEGFDSIAKQFEGVAKIEKEHEERYRKLISNIESNKVFTKENEVLWQCAHCGHEHRAKDALKLCPVCSHPMSFFRVKAENY